MRTGYYFLIPCVDYPEYSRTPCCYTPLASPICSCALNGYHKEFQIYIWIVLCVPTIPHLHTPICSHHNPLWNITCIRMCPADCPVFSGTSFTRRSKGLVPLIWNIYTQEQNKRKKNSILTKTRYTNPISLKFRFPNPH